MSRQRLTKIALHFALLPAMPLVAAALLAAVGACSDPNSGVTDSASTGETLTTGGFGNAFDGGKLLETVTAAADTGAGTGKSDLATGGDAAASETAAGCEFAANPGPGDPGAACKATSDCDSGLCVEAPDGKVCTKKCSDCCPGGWQCAQFGDVDPVFACLPRALRLCQPCKADSDCATAGDAGLCLDYAEKGRFCGSACSADSDCPANYACKSSQGVQGASKQCVRTSGECTCSQKAIADGLVTTCTIANEFGTCTGSRKCAANGLTDCTAKVPAQETCNGKDDDCDSLTDESGAANCTLFWTDADGDGFGATPANGGKSDCLCSAVGLFTAATSGDCNDNAKEIKPTAPELCNDIDDNCDGKTDETCDGDKDGYCASGQTLVGKPKICPKGGGDCDDNAAGTNPGSKEICGNGIDDNCNGNTDGEEGAVGCQQFFYDADKDGWGVGEPKCLCGPTGLFTAGNFGDCADNDASVNPAAIEVCNNGKDDNCANGIDEPDSLQCANFWADNDSDGYGSGKPQCLCAPTAKLTVKKGGDCDDANAQINPGATEICNGVDDNCNAKIDEANAQGCTKFYADMDNDAYGDTGEYACLCKPDSQHSVIVAGDCDDTKAEVNPKAKEVCDGVDNNCNGKVDEIGAGGCVDYYADIDGDGAGDPGQKACLCAKSPPYTALKGNDCDDKKDTVNPNAPEKCNGFDDNCDGTIDEEGAGGCSDFMQDGDGDGFGVSGKAKCLCKASIPYTAIKGGDCNDASPLVFPGANEVCNGIDDNCNGQIDETGSQACANYYIDGDGDGYGDSKQLPKCQCGPSGAYTAAVGGDCNDLDKQTYPTAKEICDGIDTNCNGILDDPGSAGCKSYFKDNDGDGYGVAADSQCLCNAAGAYSAQTPGDCNDNSAQVNPKAIEVCNGIDDNCNGVTDNDSPNAKAYFADADNDGFGAGAPKTLCQPDATYKVLQANDCNDSDPNINPSKAEQCNGKDDNCDSQIDNGNATTMCGGAYNATPVCTGGKCALQCAAKWFDIDGQYASGCECPADPDYQVKGGSCAAAESVGTLPDTGAQTTQSGNIMPGEAGDWYTFQAQDLPDGVGGCDQFNVHVKFTNNPDGKFVFDLYRGGCGAAEQLCASETEHNWATNFYGNKPSGPGILPNNSAGVYAPSPAPEKGGECKCTTSPGAPGMNICKDNSAQFYVRVYRAAGAPALCASYTILFANGP